MPPIIIAIDGPAGAGKGTVSRALAHALGYRHVDSGAMYRAVAWRAVHLGLSLEDEAQVCALASAAHVTVEGGTVVVDGHDVTRAIRTPAIDRAAAAVARLPEVRRVLVDRQRALGRDGGLIMEGRDIGTVVFPDAPVKVYLDASAEERARRRATDEAQTGGAAGVQEVATQMQERDRSDTTRAASPLQAAPGAVRIDTTGMSVAEVVDRVLALAVAAGAVLPTFPPRD